MIWEAIIIGVALWASVERYCQMREYIHIHSENYKE